jgi:hypothetical protein
MTQEMKTEMLNEIRSRIDRPGKVQPWLSGLNDADLWNVFVLIRQGSDNTEVSRYLIRKKLWEGSEDAGRKLIGKFRKRILSLLFQPPPRNPEPVVEKKEPASVERLLGPAAISGLDDLSQLEILQSRYAELLNKQLDEGLEGGVVSSDLSKHFQSLAAIHKVKIKLEERSEKQSRGRGSSLSRHEEQVFQGVVDKLSDGGAVMLAATRTFLALCEEEAIELPAEDNIIP